MVSHGCLSVIKYFLFLFNLFFFIFGLLLLSLGLWMVFDEVSFFLPAPSFISFSLLSYFLAIGGTVTMTLGFFGCLGALKEVRCMLGMYFFLLTILLAAQIIGGVLFFTQKTALEDKVGEYVKHLISSFRTNNSSLDQIEKTLNYIQTEENCCGWDGPQDWAGVKVPCSCYQPANSSFLDKLPQVKGNISHNTCLCHSLSIMQNNYTCNIHQKGCKQGITKWLESNMVVILSTWFAVVVVEDWLSTSFEIKAVRMQDAQCTGDLVCFLVESSSKVAFIGKNLHYSVHGTVRCLHQHMVKKQVSVV